MSAERITEIIVSQRKWFIGNDFIESVLPRGEAILVWMEESTDAIIEPAGSAVCSCTSADVSSG
jgi:hypothetical protein